MILRQTNWLSQMRVDVPHLRALESSAAGDFDTLVGRIVSGQKALVVRGFTLSGTAAGNTVSSLRLNGADSILSNLNSSESGSMYWTPADRAVETLSAASNSRVVGSFAASQTNYVGLDLVRSPDSTTVDLVKFTDAGTGKEISRTVPLARTLDYRIVITTVPFSSNPHLVPIAKVQTGAGNVLVAVYDARNMLFRLGSGGDAPSYTSFYGWPQGRGIEATATSDGVWLVGDRSIGSIKDHNDAVMTRLWELGGGERWFSPTADRNVQMIRTAGVGFSNGDAFEWDGTNLHWQGIVFLFDNSTGVVNIVDDQLTDLAGTTDLADGECLYVDLVRDNTATTVTAHKALLNTLGAGSTPGSRNVMAWRYGTQIFSRGWRYPVGTTFTPATDIALGVVALNGTPANPAVPEVVRIATGGNAENTATSGNTPGFTGKGFGTGAGVRGLGSVAGSVGVTGIASGNNQGGDFTGAGTGDGVTGTGVRGGVGVGNTSHGLLGQALTAGGYGVLGQAFGASAGVRGESSTYGVQGVASSNGSGIRGEGAGTGVGGSFIGGNTGNGISAQAGAGGGNGGVFAGVDTGHGATGFGGVSNGNGFQGQAGGNGIGVRGLGGSGSGTGVKGEGGTSAGIGVSGAGGASSGIGVKGEGGAANGIGVLGLGTGTGYGGSFSSSGGFALEVGAGHAKFTASNPAQTTAFTNAAVPSSLIKCWGNFATGTGAGAATVHAGFNVTSVSLSGTEATVTMASAMVDTEYIVIFGSEATAAQNVIFRIKPASKTTTVFKVSVSDGATDANLESTSYRIFFTVLGLQ